MDKLVITGPNTLSGEVRVSASKNATLPILAASILFPQKIVFNHLPKLSDIKFFLEILKSLGAELQGDLERQVIESQTITHTVADYDLVRKMRASILVLGPLLSRFKKAKVSLPGGCAIGSRPVDIHLTGLEQMGAEISIEKGYVVATTQGLKGAEISLAFPSVGATENLMMAAVWAKGKTVIKNAAREPEIEDLANFLNQFGTTIEGAGSETIVIEGREIEDYQKSDKSDYQIIGDRIEASTYLIAALMTKSKVRVSGVNPKHLRSVLDLLREMGAKFSEGEDYIETERFSHNLKGVEVETAPYPGFPTDVQAQVMTLMGISQGNSLVSEHIFENRFMHVPELVRMGMDIRLEGKKAYIKGVEHLSCAPVMCTDLRASAALVLAALVAEGESHINRIYHLDRGYENLEQKLHQLGAKVKRVKA
ncbi:MAG: UDP-N-acetylglucosamine 1-carboxyvinyltransferase [Halobacteriovoraceae bacterium]|nr:UDP-N-acetylglucosamine 1-carboxyvinyltransferase [Halobacteriovoraceae bacterium]